MEPKRAIEILEHMMGLRPEVVATDSEQLAALDMAVENLRGIVVDCPSKTLEECIEGATPVWSGVDVDTYLNSVRGYLDTTRDDEIDEAIISTFGPDHHHTRMMADECFRMAAEWADKTMLDKVCACVRDMFGDVFSDIDNILSEIRNRCIGHGD